VVAFLGTGLFLTQGTASAQLKPMNGLHGIAPLKSVAAVTQKNNEQTKKTQAEELNRWFVINATRAANLKTLAKMAEEREKVARSLASMSYVDMPQPGYIPTPTYVSPLTRHGISSFYDPGLHGKPMSNGRPYNKYDPTIIASWDYPLGTRLLVSYEGRSIIGVVQDRGPNKRLDRIIDLGNAAWALLAPGQEYRGLIWVSVTPIFATGRLSWPLRGNITRYPSMHGYNAIDIDGRTGDPVATAGTGKVIYSGWDSGGFGNMVIVDHTNGLQTMYGHLNEKRVSAGDFVYTGQIIGTVGNTGSSRGSHLHFEVRSNGAKLNPLDFLTKI